MEILAILGVLLAVVAIIYLTSKNLHVIVAAPVASLIILVTNQMNIIEAMLGKEQSYMAGLAGFLINNFVIFMLGSILARYMEASGATLTIANSILKVMGKDSPYKVLLAIALITSILTYGGVSIFVVIFTLLPLSRPLFKELNINWALFPLPVFMGASTYTMTTLPGTPSIQNVIPTKVLGTSLTAAPLISLAASLVLFLFGLLYMAYCLKKSLANGETYTEDDDDTVVDLAEKRPNLLFSILPLLSLIGTIFLLNKTPNVLAIGLLVSIVLSALLFYPYLPNQKELLNSGAIASIVPAFATSSTVAFGTVLTLSAGFAVIQEWIQQIPGSPLISLSVSTALLSGIIGSSSGAVGIASSNFLPAYLEMGINPEILHRVVVVASAILTVVPQSGVMITFHNLSKISMKRGLKYSFVLVTVGHILALMVILALVGLLY
ncbi:TPA: GntP family permease [Streptococcus suis]